MLGLILSLVVSALILIVISKFLPGFHVDGFGPAIIAAIVIGLVNGTLGFVLKVLTFPINFLTLGLFSFVITALMILLASKLVPGFRIDGFWPALYGALLIALAKALLQRLGVDA
jgi:putative membrane protein